MTGQTAQTLKKEPRKKEEKGSNLDTWTAELRKDDEAEFELEEGNSQQYYKKPPNLRYVFFS